MNGGGDTPTKTLWKMQVIDSWNYGDFINGNLYIAGPSENNLYNTDADGKIVNIGEFNEQVVSYAKYRLRKFFGEIQSVSIIVEQGLNVGDDVPHWDTYEVLE